MGTQKLQDWLYHLTPKVYFEHAVIKRRSPTARSHGQKRPHGQESEKAYRRPATGTRGLPTAARAGEASDRPLRCFQFSIGHAFAQAPWPGRQRNPRERPRPSRRHGRPPRTPWAQPSRPDVACDVPHACPRSPRAAEQNASLPQRRPTDGRLGLLAIRLPEQPRALQMLKSHASRRSESPNHNLGLPEPLPLAAPDPGAARPRLPCPFALPTQCAQRARQRHGSAVQPPRQATLLCPTNYHGEPTAQPRPLNAGLGKSTQKTGRSSLGVAARNYDTTFVLWLESKHPRPLLLRHQQ